MIQHGDLEQTAFILEDRQRYKETETTSQRSSDLVISFLNEFVASEQVLDGGDIGQNRSRKTNCWDGVELCGEDELGVIQNNFREVKYIRSMLQVPLGP